MPFELPNFTQNPNEFYDIHLPDMKLAEIKVVLVIIRKTYGFHIEDCRVKYTLSEMCKLTGLKRQAVLDGAAKAEARGLIEKSYSDKGELLWSVRLPDRHKGQGSQNPIPDTVRISDRPTSPKERVSKKDIGAPAAPQESSQAGPGTQGALPLGMDDQTLGQGSSGSTTAPQAAPEPAPKTSPENPKKGKPGKADPRSSHPAIVAIHEIMGRYPNKSVYDQLIRVIGDHPNTTDLKACYEAWTIKGWRPDNFTWVTEWPVSGIPAGGKPGTNGVNEPKSWQALRNVADQYEREAQQAQPQN